VDEDVLGLHDGAHNGSSEKLEPTQSEPQQILATKNGSNRSPRLITIQCSLEITQPQSGPPSIIGVQGYLDWGVNGCSHIASFDWLQGCTFTLTATSFKLRAKLRRNVLAGTNVMAKASAAYGTKAGPQLQLSTDHAEMDAGNNQVYDVPPWATHGLLVVNPFAVLPPREVRIEALTFNNLLRYEVRPNDCTEVDQFPVSCDVQRVRLTNLSAVRINAAIIWRLSL
jgi:hypothetical protein